MKVITAIGNPYLNNKIKEYENVEVVGKDIQYQEGILEILEEKSDIDLLILSNDLPEDLDFKVLINKIIKKKENLKIVVFLKEKNDNIEQFLNSKKIYKIYYLNEINYDIFLNNFLNNNKKTKEKIAEEIKEFKRLILENNTIKIEKNNYKNNNKLENKFY